MKEGNVVELGSKKTGPESFVPYIRIGLFLLLLIVISSTIISNLFIVKENEYRVIRQFGEVTRVVNEPGLTYKIPFLQSVTTLPKHQLLFDTQPTEVNTKDKKKIIVDNYVVWRIVNPTEMIQNARTISNVEKRMSESVSSTLRNELGSLDYSAIINEKKSARGDFNQLVTNKVNEVLQRDRFGIEIIEVRVKRTDLPAQNENSVYNRMISERHSKAQEYLSIGEAEATKIKAATDRSVTEMLSVADAKAKQVQAQGEAEAARIYNAVYSQDPAFYSLYRTLESYKTTLQGQPVIVMPINSPYAKYLQGAR
ncbi:MAG TPA: protease modulator HflC [Candidatus Bathyarchaeia archaeon]|nr:protease modulator HflC [Candidatus Bathyarchaeia archaeon]